MKKMMVVLGCFLACMVLRSAVLAAPATIEVTKCSVSAGKGTPADSFAVSGITNMGQSMQNGKIITVVINCPTMSTPLHATFEVDDERTFKKGKFKDTVKDGISTYTFACDAQNGKFAFSAKKVDLTGLCCPFTLTINIGLATAQTFPTQTQVNGGKGCPSLLMMGTFNDLQIPKFTPKFGKTAGTDSFSAQGTFNVDGVFQMTEPFILTLGSKSYYVPGIAFKSVNGVVSCSNAPAAKGGIVSAKFDTNTGIFTITVKNTSIEDFGEVDFDLSLFGILLGVTEKADLGPKQTFSLENDLRHFNVPSIGNFTPNGYRIVSGTSSPNYYSRFESSDEDTLYLFTDSNGTYLKGANLSGEYYECSIDVNVLTNPDLMRIGQPFTNQKSFTGSLEIWLPDEPQIDITVTNFAGTVKVTTKTLKWENISVPAGNFDAVKIEQTFALSGTADVYVDLGGGINTTGTFTCTYKLTYWCDPSIGVVKLIDTGSEKATAKGVRSLSESWNNTYFLTGRTF